jgi:hypothetical protein
MKLTDRINELFNKFNVNLKTEEVNLEAQGVLDNGTIVYTDADSFVEGADVFVMNEEGERIPLPEGEYTFEDGTTLKISNGGKVAKSVAKGADGEGSEGEGGNGEGGAAGVAGGNPGKGGTKPTKAPPKKKGKSAQSKLAEEDEESNVNIDVEVDEKDKEELMDDAYIIDLINRVLDERFPAEVVEAEEIKEEEEEEEEITMSVIKKLQKDITELKLEAASGGVKRVKKQKAKFEPVDLTKLSNEERITALFNQFNK